MKPPNGTNGLMRILGVDPAAAGPTGYGIIESDGHRCRVLHYGALSVAEKLRAGSPGAALEAVHRLICDLINDYRPHALAVESVFAALNMKTALRLAEVHGVVLLAAAQHGLQAHSYAPREVKAAVAGYGHADKRQMQLMVRAILSMNETPEPADAADALAVALCHVQAAEVRRRFGLAASSGLPLSGGISPAPCSPARGSAVRETSSRIPVTR